MPRRARSEIVLRGHRTLACVLVAAAYLSGCALERAPKLRGERGFGAAPQPDAASSSPEEQATPMTARLAAPLGCPSLERADRNGPRRTACDFPAGASVAETLGFDPAEGARLPVRNVIVMMKENRSFDHLFGRLHERGQPDAERVPDTFMNLDRAGQEIYPFHADTTCYNGDPKHQWSAMHSAVDSGAMDGFVRSSRKPWVMAFYDDHDLPFYYFLAKTFALADRYFPSVRSGTWPNREYLLRATSGHVVSTGDGTIDPSLPTIFSELDAKGVPWGVYTVDAPFVGALGWTTESPGVASLEQFFTQLEDGSLPPVAFVDSVDKQDDDHPPADLQLGEAWTRRVYEAARKSPLWRGLVLLWMYDESGGFADHVPPPSTCVGRPEDARFFELGARVPMVAISRFARPHFVSHLVHEHTSVLRFIELLFDLPALTARDANSDALLDMFDFDCPNDAIPDAPEPGQGGCTSGPAAAPIKEQDVTPQMEAAPEP